MKKFFAILLFSVMCLCLVACGDTTPRTDPADVSVAETTKKQKKTKKKPKEQNLPKK